MAAQPDRQGVAGPRGAAVFCVDEKSPIQALDRRDRILPFSPGRAEPHGFEYIRHGTLSPLAAPETRSGAVTGKTVERHTSEQFVGFLEELVGGRPRGRKTHIILDHLSTHKTERAAQFLVENPKVRLHYAPTCASWLNRVEIWFSKIERQMIRRGVFTSVNDLRRKIMRYIRLYNRSAAPIRRACSDHRRSIKHAIGEAGTAARSCARSGRA